MRGIILLLLVASSAFAAEDAWAKVRELKGGVELRIYKKGQKQPVLARLDEARETSLVVIVKNEQTAIDKEDIDRIDWRATQSGSRVKPGFQTTAEGPDRESKVSRIPQRPPNRSRTTSGGLTLHSGPPFETVYRRPETPSQK